MEDVGRLNFKNIVEKNIRADRGKEQISIITRSKSKLASSLKQYRSEIDMEREIIRGHINCVIHQTRTRKPRSKSKLKNKKTENNEAKKSQNCDTNQNSVNIGVNDKIFAENRMVKSNEIKNKKTENNEAQKSQNCDTNQDSVNTEANDKISAENLMVKSNKMLQNSKGEVSVAISTPPKAECCSIQKLDSSSISKADCCSAPKTDCCSAPKTDCCSIPQVKALLEHHQGIRKHRTIALDNKNFENNYDYQMNLKELLGRRTILKSMIQDQRNLRTGQLELSREISKMRDKLDGVRDRLDQSYTKLERNHSFSYNKLKTLKH